MVRLCFCFIIIIIETNTQCPIEQKCYDCLSYDFFKTIVWWWLNDFLSVWFDTSESTKFLTSASPGKDLCKLCKLWEANIKVNLSFHTITFRHSLFGLNCITFIYRPLKLCKLPMLYSGRSENSSQTNFVRSLHQPPFHHVGDARVCESQGELTSCITGHVVQKPL